MPGGATSGQCAVGEVCRQDTFRCQTGTCGSNDECAEALFCNMTTLACAQCTEGSQCDEDETCQVDTGACIAANVTTGPGNPIVGLSECRAESVRKYLGKGVDASRIEAKGAGPDQPLVPNNQPGGRQKNRRIEFHILQ